MKKKNVMGENMEAGTNAESDKKAGTNAEADKKAVVIITLLGVLGIAGRDALWLI